MEKREDSETILLMLQVGVGMGNEPSPRIAAMYEDAAPFEQALAKESAPPATGHRVTGITVPHHLLAADLIARGLRCASGGNYERIILLSPDHFRRSQLPFATTFGTFETVVGDIACDELAIRSLLAACPQIADSALFTTEHGSRRASIHRKVLPHGKDRAGVIADRLTARGVLCAGGCTLVPLVDSKTLIVQSTDFSRRRAVNA